MNKLGFSEHDVGRMTFRKWVQLYKSYKKSFDNELLLVASKTTYAQAEKEITIDDVIPLQKGGEVNGNKHWRKGLIGW